MGSPPTTRWTGAVLVVGCALVTSCGYRPLVAEFPEGNGAVVIPTAGNHTPYAGLAGPLTDALRTRAKISGIRVAAKGAPKLIVTIASVTSRAGSIGVDGNRLYPIDKVQTIKVVAFVEGSNGRVLVSEESFEAHGRSPAGDSVRTEAAMEASRRGGILDEIAEMIVSYMFYRY